MFFYILHVLEGKDRKALIMEQESEQVDRYDEILNSLLQGWPLQYVLNRASFYDMDLFVDENVLIPRPETEELVAWITEDLKDKELKILDVGTGSGCIAVALKKLLPQCKLLACDLSANALKVAKHNAKEQEVEIEFLQLDALTQQLPIVDVIVSNPPYIPLSEKAEMQSSVTEYEPEMALFVNDADPLVFYKILIEHALKQGAKAYFEIHEEMKEQLSQVLQAYNCNFEFRKDLQSKYRMLRIEI